MAKKKTGGDFWHTANCSFSKKERAAFNRWLFDMRYASEKVIEQTHFLPDDERSSVVSSKARELNSMINRVPFLF